MDVLIIIAGLITISFFVASPVLINRHYKPILDRNVYGIGSALVSVAIMIFGMIGVISTVQGNNVCGIVSDGKMSFFAMYSKIVPTSGSESEFRAFPADLDISACMSYVIGNHDNILALMALTLLGVLILGVRQFFKIKADTNPLVAFYLTVAMPFLSLLVTAVIVGIFYLRSKGTKSRR